jgi:hypothetical protein
MREKEDTEPQRASGTEARDFDRDSGEPAATAMEKLSAGRGQRPFGVFP